MKHTFLIFTLFLIVFSASAQKFWEQSSYTGKIDKSKTYKVAVLPVKSADALALSAPAAANAAYNQLYIELAAITNFNLISKNTVEQAVNKFNFGISGLSPASYAALAKELGADLFVVAELSNEKQKIKKYQVGTVMAFVQVFDMKNDAMVLYVSRARAINPVSPESEAEFAVQKALKKLVEALK